MQFQVPQFIEIEDKIFGPLTFKQFVYLAGGAGLAFVFYVFLPSFIKWFAILAIGATAIAFAFIKYNDRPMINAAEAGFKYLLSKKLYLWVQTPNSAPKVMMGEKANQAISQTIPKLSESKLADLSWSLDVKDTVK